MKYIIGIPLAIAFMKIGINKGNRLIKRKKIFNEINMFISFCQEEIKYSKASVIAIITKFILYHRNLLFLCELNISNGDFYSGIETALCKNKAYLSNEEQNQIVLLFGLLGKSDADTQINLLCSMKNTFEEYLSEATEKEKNELKLCYILGFGSCFLTLLTVI